jgi:hypothetical protein
VMVSTSEVGLTVLPRSLRFMDDVRAARTEEKIGHSGRDDREEQAEEGRPSAVGGTIWNG